MSSRYVQIIHFEYPENINIFVTKLNYLLVDEMFSRDIRKLKFLSVQHSQVGYKYNHLIYNLG
jgi:hypothetical protein